MFIVNTESKMGFFSRLFPSKPADDQQEGEELMAKEAAKKASFWELVVSTDSYFNNVTTLEILAHLLPFRTLLQSLMGKEGASVGPGKVGTDIMSLFNLITTILALVHLTNNHVVSFQSWWLLSLFAWMFLLVMLAAVWVDPPHFGNPWRALLNGVYDEFLIVSFLYYDVMWCTLSFLWLYTNGDGVVVKFTGNAWFDQMDKDGFHTAGIKSFSEMVYFTTIGTTFTLMLYTIMIKVREHNARRITARHVDIKQIQGAVEKAVEDSAKKTRPASAPVHRTTQPLDQSTPNRPVSQTRHQNVSNRYQAEHEVELDDTNPYLGNEETSSVSRRGRN